MRSPSLGGLLICVVQGKLGLTIKERLQLLQSAEERWLESYRQSMVDWNLRNQVCPRFPLAVLDGRITGYTHNDIELSCAEYYGASASCSQLLSRTDHDWPVFSSSTSWPMLLLLPSVRGRNLRYCISAYAHPIENRGAAAKGDDGRAVMERNLVASLPYKCSHVKLASSIHSFSG